MKIEEIKKEILNTYFTVWCEYISPRTDYSKTERNLHTLCILGNILDKLGISVQEEIDKAKEKFPILEWLYEDRENWEKNNKN